MDIAPLAALLQGQHPADAVTLSPAQQVALHHIVKKLQEAWTSRRILELPISLLLNNAENSPYAVICQWQNRKGESSSPMVCDIDKCDGNIFRILEWVFLSVQPKTSIQTWPEAVGELIRKGRERIVEMSGQEPDDISIPINAADLEWWLQNATPIQEALCNYGGKVHSQQPKGKLWQVLRRNQWIERTKVHKDPLADGLTVYTDAGKRTRRAACVWQEKGQWNKHLIEGQAQDSLQTLELTAVVWALNNWLDYSLNVVTDSLYVAGIVLRLEDSLIRETTNPRLGRLFIQLRSTISQRTKACCVIHVRSHQWNIGWGQGNQVADSLVSPVCHVPPIDKFQQARQSHDTFHQTAKGLRR